jgi:hypothetical protein
VWKNICRTHAVHQAFISSSCAGANTVARYPDRHQTIRRASAPGIERRRKNCVLLRVPVIFDQTSGTAFVLSRLSQSETQKRNPEMRTAHALIFAVAGSALISVPASAQRVCNQNCVGPLCNEQCVESNRDRDITVGRGRARDRDVIIEERRYRDRDPGVEIRRSRPGLEIEIGR